ncbi:MAG: hypothetical protein R6W84_07085 [Promethearchaeia archaeon]
MSSLVIFLRFACLVNLRAVFVNFSALVSNQLTNSSTASRATISAPLCFISLLIGDQDM